MRLTPAGVRAIKQAIRQRWPLGEALRAKTMARLEEALDDDDPRMRVAAAKTIIEADKVNLAQEAMASTQEMQVDDAEPVDADALAERIRSGLARLAAPRIEAAPPASDGGTAEPPRHGLAGPFEFDDGDAGQMAG